MDIEELKRRKKALKITTEQLAYIAELPYSTTSKIFTGETKKPSFLTIEKIDSAITKLECQHRIEVYYKEMEEFFKEHPGLEYDQKFFEKKYRKDHHLDDSPIPFSKELDSNDSLGNLALESIPKALDISSFLNLNTEKNTWLLDGKLIYNQAPSLEHQLLLENLADSIKTFIKSKNGVCKVLSTGVNVQLDEYDNSLLIPDLMVLCHDLQRKDFGFIGAPDWIIEVTSPSTRHFDYKEKMFKYMEYGVREYWVIDLQKKIVATYVNDMPLFTAIYQFNDDIPVFIYEGRLTLKISELT